MPVTGLAADPKVKLHDGGPGHPEQPARIEAVQNQLKSTGLMERLAPIRSRAASDDELALVHARDYLALVSREIAGGAAQLSTGDTPVNSHSETVARHLCGLRLGRGGCGVYGRSTERVLPDSAAGAPRERHLRHGLLRI